jgi:hypothetical protein
MSEKEVAEKKVDNRLVELFHTNRFRRLRSTIRFYEFELNKLEHRVDSKTTSIDRNGLLENAKGGLRARDYYLGWQNIHSLHREMVDFYGSLETMAEIESLLCEAGTDKLKIWRQKAISICCRI